MSNIVTIYRLDVYDTAGNKQAEKVDFIRLGYALRVNKVGLLDLTLSGDHELLGMLKSDWQIEVWRKPDKGAWRREITGLYRHVRWSYPESSIVNMQMPGIMSMLGDKYVGYPAGTTDRNQFLVKPAETILNTLVKYNATTAGTVADGRLRLAANGYPLTGLTVEADGGEGNVLSVYCFGQPLMKVLEETAIVGGGDYDVVKVSSTEWQFQWYTGQLGIDRSDDVIFAMERANMANPVYELDARNEKSVALVAGQGEGIDREFLIVNGAAYSATNDRELFVDARDIGVGDTAALQVRGVQRLKELQLIERFDFDVKQVKNATYGINYFLGDLVKAINPLTWISYIMKVAGVTVAFEPTGDENISVDMEMA